MLNCREISELVSRSLDDDLTTGQSLEVRFHLLLCSACRAFDRQVRFLHAACTVLAARHLSGEGAGPAPGPQDPAGPTGPDQP